MKPRSAGSSDASRSSVVAGDVETSRAEERGEGVRERAEIAAGADGAAQRHERDHAAVEHRLHDVDELAADAGVSLQERVEPRGQNGADDVGGEVVREIVGIAVLADADGVREQQIALELFEIGGRDRLVFEFAEAGGDAVLGRRRLARFPRAAIVLDDLRDELFARGDALVRRRIDLHAHAVARDAHELLDRERVAVEEDGVGHGGSSVMRRRSEVCATAGAAVGRGERSTNSLLRGSRRLRGDQRFRHLR